MKFKDFFEHRQQQRRLLLHTRRRSAANLHINPHITGSPSHNWRNPSIIHKKSRRCFKSLKVCSQQLHLLLPPPPLLISSGKYSPLFQTLGKFLFQAVQAEEKEISLNFEKNHHFGNFPFFFSVCGNWWAFWNTRLWMKEWMTDNSDVTLMWLWRDSDVTLMWLWCDSDVTLMWLWCDSDVTLTWLWCDSDVTLMWLWCDSDVTLMWLWCDSDVTRSLRFNSLFLFIF